MPTQGNPAVLGRRDRERELVARGGALTLSPSAMGHGPERRFVNGERADPARLLDPVVDLRTSTHGERSLASILFTDLVGSTELAVRLGDAAYVRLLAEHDAIAQVSVSSFAGRTVHTTGDGILAVFGLPSSALRCAAAFRSAASNMGLRVRCGVHAGEIQDRGDDVGGVHVNIAARVCARAAPGEVLVSDVARQLAFGAGLTFTTNRRVKLRGLPGSWILSALLA